ncbi:cell wall-binding repeat-containing protein [Desulfosporosinus sp.]|uniref:cell wall-binding repeat-containing protein n=1 Tax=Desulfosporosinus sp. TaxID=157907 RepID=UPI0025BF11F8|nr:cell wall-binding repeat-containing protein [Desulfosporosinus sp.]MBC2726358.1 cell wall-binding repeat-containing protein [Desulfosporosinus sp.]
MKKTKKALATLAIAGMTLSMIPFNVFAAAPVPTRIAGVTAEQTAVQIADQTGYTGKAILASSTSYGMVDALTAGPLAASLQAPILLTGAGNTLDASTKAELTKLAVKTVYVTSGTAVIKQGVIDELKAMGIEVISLGGFDRAETSVNIAKKMTGVTKVAIANTVPDALSIAAIASAANQPILLTNKGALPSSVADYLASAGVTSSDVIGGTGVISDAVVAGLPGATRHFGMTAYDTNNQVIQDFAASIEFDNVYVANGQTGIDALAGAPLAAQTKSAIVLTDGKSVPAAAEFTYSKSPVGAVVTALGGAAVVPDAIRAGVAAGKVTPVTNELSIVSISALNDENSVLQIKFTKPVTSFDRGDIVIQNAKTLARYGVETASLLSGGMIAELKLYETIEGQKVLQSNTDYNVTVKANGETLTAKFNRGDWREAAITSVNSEDKEIVIAGITLEVTDPKFDYQNALGRTARVWFNQDKEVNNIAYTEQVVKYDAIEVTKANEIKLLTEDEKYDVADQDFLIYDDGTRINSTTTVAGPPVVTTVNNAIDLALAPVGTQFDFAKVVFDSDGDVVFVGAYDWQDYLVVDSVDNDVVVGVDGSGEFNAEDAVIVKNGTEIAPSALKAGDILYYSNSARGNDGLAEVLSNTVKGEIDTVYSDAIEVEGETYDFLAASPLFGDADYINKDGDLAEIDDSDIAEELQAGGEVVLNFDRKGDLVFVGGDVAEVASSSNFGYVEEQEDITGYMQAGKARLQLSVIDENKDTKNYDIVLEDLDTITFNGHEYDVDTTPDAVNEAYFSLATPNADQTYQDLQLSGIGSVLGPVAPIDTVNLNTFNDLINLELDDSGNVVGLEYSTNPVAITVLAANSVESGDKYAAGKLIQSSTLVYEVNASNEVKKVSKWSDLSGFEVTVGEVYFDTNNKAEVIVARTSNAADVEQKKAYVTDVRSNSDGIVRITAFIDGEEVTLTADELSSTVTEGDVVMLDINEDSNEIDAIGTVNDPAYVTTPTTLAVAAPGVIPVNVGAREITLLGDATPYELESGGFVIDATDPNDVKVVPFTDLNDVTTETITVILGASGTHFAQTIIIE